MKRIFFLLTFLVMAFYSSVQAESFTLTSTGQHPPIRLSVSENSLTAVYVCYDFDNVSIDFDKDTTLQWYKYSAGNVPEIIPGEIINKLKITEGDMGYGVLYGGKMYWVWLVDYQKYLANAKSLAVRTDNDDQCNNLYLNAPGFKMSYYEPSSSLAHSIDLQLSLKYNTMEFSESAKSYETKKDKEVLLTSNNFTSAGIITLNEEELPLQDTRFTIGNDRFATEWGLNQTLQTVDTYTAVKVAVSGLHTHDPLHNEDNNTGGNETSESLTGTAPFNIVFNAYANQPTATYYSWIITNTVDRSRITTSSDDNIRYTFDKSGKYSVRVIVTNAANSCVDSLNYDVEVSESELKVPNAFSPGLSPGENDEFKVAYKSIVRFQGWIFNRWGVQLFHWSDPAKGWDGKVNGKYVTPGAYFYVIEAEGSDGIKYKKKGDVNVFSGK